MGRRIKTRRTTRTASKDPAGSNLDDEKIRQRETESLFQGVEDIFCTRKNACLCHPRFRPPPIRHFDMTGGGVGVFCVEIESNHQTAAVAAAPIATVEEAVAAVELASSSENVTEEDDAGMKSKSEDDYVEYPKEGPLPVPVLSFCQLINQGLKTADSDTIE